MVGLAALLGILPLAGAVPEPAARPEALPAVLHAAAWRPSPAPPTWPAPTLWQAALTSKPGADGLQGLQLVPVLQLGAPTPKERPFAGTGLLASCRF